MNLLNTKAASYGAMVLVGGALLYWVANRVIDRAASAAQAVNPASDKNLAYRGVNAVGAAVSGDSSWSLGSWIYDVTHPGEGERIRSTPPYVPRKIEVREESKVYDWLTDHG